MPISKKQLGRMIRLVAQLKENRYPNCTRFASEMRKSDLDENLNLACTPKTIYRDIQILKQDFDASIKFDTKRNGYYPAYHGWTFSWPQIFDDAKMHSDVLGARVAEHIFPEPMKSQIRNAVDYLLTYNNPDFLDKAQIDSFVIIPSNRTKIDEKIFMPLFYAWQNHEICHITYQDSTGKANERDFEPHALVVFDGFWYTKGFCHIRNEIRTLFLPRMKSVVPTGETFTPDSKIIQTANEEGFFDPEMILDVIVHCNEYHANIIQTRTLTPEQKITLLANCGCELRVKSMSKYHLITWIMHQCGRATLTAPEMVKRKIMHWATCICDSHK